jgi:hypothetical protein
MSHRRHRRMQLVDHWSIQHKNLCTRIYSCKDDWVFNWLNNFVHYKLIYHFINMSNGRHWSLLIFCQFWMPNIDYKHKSCSCAIMPHLMLKTVIKYKQLSLFPGPKNIYENSINVQPGMTRYRTYIAVFPKSLCSQNLCGFRSTWWNLKTELRAYGNPIWRVRGKMGQMLRLPCPLK